MKITRGDFHIPSAREKTARLSRIQYPKGQNPLRLPFAGFRLIFGLEKTFSCIDSKAKDPSLPCRAVSIAVVVPEVSVTVIV